MMLEQEAVIDPCPFCGMQHEALSCPIPPDDQLAFGDEEDDEV